VVPLQIYSSCGLWCVNIFAKGFAIFSKTKWAETPVWFCVLSNLLQSLGAPVGCNLIERQAIEEKNIFIFVYFRSSNPWIKLKLQEIKYNFMYGFIMVFLSISVLISLKTILHNLNWNNPVCLIQYHIMLIMITGTIKLNIKLKLSYVTFQQFNEIKKIDIKFSAHDAFLE
jgi:hypothetical protein